MRGRERGQGWASPAPRHARRTTIGTDLLIRTLPAPLTPPSRRRPRAGAALIAQFYGRGGGISSSSSIAVDASVVRKRGREGARRELVGGGGVYSVPMGADNAEADRIGSADSSQERGREKEGSEGGRFGVGVAPLVGLVGLGKQRRAGGGGSGGDGLSEDVECAICMEVIASWETVKLPCCHRFCASCVGEIYSGRNATRDTQGKSTSKKVSGAQQFGPLHRLASPLHSIQPFATTT